MEPVPSSAGPAPGFPSPARISGSPVTPGLTPLSRPTPGPDSGMPRKNSRHRACRQESGPCQQGGQLIAAARRGIRGHGIAYFILGDDDSATAPVVNDHRAGGGQGGAGRPVVVAAQQQINRMRPCRGGRDEDPHYRPGGAAAGPITQIVRPGPGSPIFGGRSSRLAAGGPPGLLGPAARKPHPHPASIRGLRAVSPGA